MRQKHDFGQLPGHHVQIDVKFIAPLTRSRLLVPPARQLWTPARARRKRYYQYTAIDNGMRLRVLRIYEHTPGRRRHRRHQAVQRQARRVGELLQLPSPARRPRRPDTLRNASSRRPRPSPTIYTGCTPTEPGSSPLGPSTARAAALLDGSLGRSANPALSSAAEYLRLR